MTAEGWGRQSPFFFLRRKPHGPFFFGEKYHTSIIANALDAVLRLCCSGEKPERNSKEGKQGDEEGSLEDRAEGIAADSAQLCFYCHRFWHHHVGRGISVVSVAFVQYTGAYQFVLVSLMAGGASLVTVAVTALLMNSRQMFYALSFVDEFRGMGAKLPLMVHTLTDETYAVDCSLPRDLPGRKDVLFLVAMLSYAYWILGTLLGAALGQILPWNLEGIDFCMTALFVVILMQQWEKTSDHFPALLGGGMALICLAALGADRFMLPALLITSAILFATRTGEVKKS